MTPRPAETPLSAGGFRSEVLRSWAEVAEVAGSWNELLRCSGADTIFLSWEWIQAWAGVVGSLVEPLVIVCRDADGGLAGIAPFYEAQWRLLRTLPYRGLRIMGDYPTSSEYGDWIVRRDSEGPVIQAITDALNRLPGWDYIWMPRTAGWTGCPERLSMAARSGSFLQNARDDSFSFVPLPGSIAAYTAGLSKQRRKSLGREQARILDRRQATVVRCRTGRELTRFLDALFDLHHRRWKARGEEGSFRRKPMLARFYRAFASLALERNWLRITAVEAQGVIKAIEFGYVYGNVYHSMQGGFDPEYESGVGNVLRLKVIESCIEEGLSGFDLLGGLTEDKRTFGAIERRGQDVILARNRPKGWLLTGRLVSRLRFWPTGRYMRQEAPLLDGLPEPAGSGDRDAPS